MRDIWIEDEGDNAKLVAKMEITEPDVKEKVLRGTFADVSCGIPWSIVSRGKKYGATLEHVAITNRPFIDGLGPFLAASNSTLNAEVEHFGEVEDPATPPSPETPPETPGPTPDPETPPETPDPTPDPEVEQLSFSQIVSGAKQSLRSNFGLSHHYVPLDVRGNQIQIWNAQAETTWMAPYEIKEGAVALSPVTDWTIEENEGATDEPAPRSSTQLSELDQARRLRELRFSQPTITRKEGDMPVTREDLEATRTVG